MTEPTRATRASSYLDMLGIRPRSRVRRREPEPEVEIGEARIEPDVDVEIGEAQVEAPSIDFRGEGSSDPEAIAASTIARLEAQQPTTRARTDARHADLERDADRDRRRDAAYERSLIDGLVMDSDNLEALRAGTVQGATLGFADELEGASVDPWDRQAQPRGFARAERATYESARDEARASNETARRAAPRAYGAGEALGGSLPALALPASTARTALGRIASSGVMGGAFGGAQGYGHAEGDEQLDDVVRGAGVGFVGGAGGQAVGEIGGAVGRWFRGAPEGTPRAGGDFTPEQQAQINRDPELRQLDSRRSNVELEAASRRVRSANPNVTRAELETIDETYEGGVRGLGRDMDASGIAPRRSFGTPSSVQARAADAGRPEMPPGVQAGRFNDDVTIHPAPGTQPPISQRARDATATRDAAEYADVRAAEARALRETQLDDAGVAARDAEIRGIGERERATRARGAQRDSAMSDADRALAEEATPPRGRRRDAPEPFFEEGEFAEGMRAGNTRGRRETFVDEGDPVVAYRPPAAPAYRRQPVSVDDEPLDFASLDVAEPVELGVAAGARRRANIRAAERRTARGGYSESTHDERTWPVSLSDVEDITPRQAPPAQPPPLPRRAPPAQNLGRWDAPAVEAPQPQASAPTRTPGQRASEVLGPMSRRDTFARVARDEGVFAAPRRTVEDLAMRWLPVDSTRAAIGEFRSDAMANEIMQRLSARPATTPFRRALESAAERGPRAFGVTLVSLANRHPEVQEALAPLLTGNTRGAEGAMSASPVDPDTGVPYADQYVDGQPPADDGEDVDYGVPYADEYDEQGQLRAQQRRQ